MSSEQVVGFRWWKEAGASGAGWFLHCGLCSLRGGPLAGRRVGRWILREALPSLSSEDGFKRAGTPVFIGHL